MAAKKKIEKRNERGWLNQLISLMTPWNNKEVENSFKPQINITTQKDMNRMSPHLSTKTLYENMFGDDEDKSTGKSTIRHKLDSLNKNLKTSVQESVTNEQILEYFPDVNAAKGIIIDSILSPNNLKRESMSIMVEKSTITDEAIIANVSKILNDYFIKEMKLDSKLEIWFRENTLYRWCIRTGNYTCICKKYYRRYESNIRRKRKVYFRKFYIWSIRKL